MAKPSPMLFELQKLVSDLSLINRNHLVLGTDRAENDIEHSFAVALLCWYIYEQHKLKLDLAKVLKYALIHDFVERYAGDVNAFASKKDRLKKVKSEAASLKRLSKEFEPFQDLVHNLEAYEAKLDEEALFVWSVDKMQALVLADMDSWRPYQRLGINFETFIQKHHEQLAACSAHCREIFETLLEYCKTTFYDKPAVVQTVD